MTVADFAMKARLSRLDQIYTEDLFYSLTFCTHERRTILATGEIDGAFRRFADHLMRNDESYGAKWEYVSHNPVRHGLVSEAALWPYQGEITALAFG
ncbi:MAG: hypothetical protein WDO13_03405 [Verrucomicrobiota bacterium]